MKLLEGELGSERHIIFDERKKDEDLQWGFEKPEEDDEDEENEDESSDY